MKVLVIAEDSTEVLAADRVVATLPQFLPSILANIAHVMNRHPVPWTARAMEWRALFDGVRLEPEVRAYIEALERAVFVKDGVL